MSRRRRATALARQIGRNKADARRQGKTLAHGTTTAYDKGCRCEPCRHAHLRSVSHPIAQGATWVQETIDALDRGRARPG